MIAWYSFSPNPSVKCYTVYFRICLHSYCLTSYYLLSVNLIYAFVCYNLGSLFFFFWGGGGGGLGGCAVHIGVGCTYSLV